MPNKGEPMTSLQIATAIAPDYVRYLFALTVVCGTASGLAGYFFAGLVRTSRMELTLVDPDSTRARFLIENIGNCRQLARKLLLTACAFIGMAAMTTAINKLVYGMPISLF